MDVLLGDCLWHAPLRETPTVGLEGLAWMVWNGPGIGLGRAGSGRTGGKLFGACEE